MSDSETTEGIYMYDVRPIRPRSHIRGLSIRTNFDDLKMISNDRIAHQLTLAYIAFTGARCVEVNQDRQYQRQ